MIFLNRLYFHHNSNFIIGVLVMTLQSEHYLRIEILGFMNLSKVWFFNEPKLFELCRL